MCSGLNPAIRAVTIRVYEGYQVIGIRRGWQVWSIWSGPQSR